VLPPNDDFFIERQGRQQLPEQERQHDEHADQLDGGGDEADGFWRHRWGAVRREIGEIVIWNCELSKPIMTSL
jgi:hypothetical protein